MRYRSLADRDTQVRSTGWFRRIGEAVCGSGAQGSDGGCRDSGQASGRTRGQTWHCARRRGREPVVWLGSYGTWAAECGGGTEDTNCIFDFRDFCSSKTRGRGATRARGVFSIFDVCSVRSEEDDPSTTETYTARRAGPVRRPSLRPWLAHNVLYCIRFMRHDFSRSGSGAHIMLSHQPSLAS